MAHYVARIRSPRSIDEAFAYMADLTNFQQWDPGVISAVQVDGEGPGAGASFDVEVKGFPRPLTLRYHLMTFDAPHRVVARAQSKALTSLDTITVSADGSGSIVTYEADLTLNGPLAIADPLVKLVFTRIGDRAAAGLRRALDADIVEEAA